LLLYHRDCGHFNEILFANKLKAIVNVSFTIGHDRRVDELHSEEMGIPSPAPAEEELRSRLERIIREETAILKALESQRYQV
jgi:hypothetical protein